MKLSFLAFNELGIQGFILYSLFLVRDKLMSWKKKTKRKGGKNEKR